MTREANGSAPLRKWLPIVSGLVALTGGIGTVLYQVFHVTYETQSNTAEISVLRAELAGVRANAAAIAAMQRDLNEIDTRFCAADDLRNLMHSNDLRAFAALYEKVHGVPFPIANAFYPQVCRRPTTAR